MQLSTVSDKKDRTRNVIIYGLEESDLENLEEEARRVLAELDDKPVKCYHGLLSCWYQKTGQ